MGTYNAAPFLDDQINSIQRQGEKAWTLIVRDDGSSDDTPRVLARRAETDPRIRLLQDRLGRLGPSGNFGRLMEVAYAEGAGYVMLCDQDDVWLPEKVGQQMRAMGEAERRWGKVTPLIVHSDLVVADAKLHTIHPSFFAYQGLRHEGARALPTLLVQNFVTGCTLLANRPLLEMALPIPKEAPMHDWWLALCAAAAGRIACVPRPLVVYRQHASNVIGASDRSPARLIRPGLSERLARNRRVFLASFDLARTLRKRLSQRHVAPENLRLLTAYANLPTLTPWRRLLTVLRLGIRPQTLPRSLLFYARLLSQIPLRKP